MRRIIFSLYIDIPDHNLVSHHESKKKFQDNYEWLLSKQQEYADKLGIEYRHYKFDDDYILFSEMFVLDYPEISEYNIVNFYKIHLLYKLAEEYDEILYLDFDVIPVTNLNFFEEWDFSKGIAIMTGTAEAQKEINEFDTLKYNHHVRSPMAKYWNTKCMLQERELPTDNIDVFNTGIVGASKEHLKSLDYFGDFKDTIEFMKELTQDDFYPDRIRNMFGFDNETIWGFKTLSNDIPYQKLENGWHHFMDKWSYIPSDVKLVHCVSKDFDYVRNWCEKNNL